MLVERRTEEVLMVISEYFGGPGGALSRMCVCVRRVTFKRNDL